MFRSQIAKAIYNTLAKDSFIAESYGVSVAKLGYEGKKLSDFSQLSVLMETMKKHGMDISGEFCKQLHLKNLEGVSKIIVMAEKESILPWLMSYDYEYWEVPNEDADTADIVEDIILILRDKINALQKE